MTVTERPATCNQYDPRHLIASLPGMKPEHWQPVLDQLDDPRQLLDLSPASLKALRLPPKAREHVHAWQHQSLDAHLSERLRGIQRRCESRGIELVDWADARYPTRLRCIHGPPPVLYVRGDVEALTRPSVAVVGSRHASRDGLNHAYRFADALAERGVTVISGLALGIDAAAHRGALNAGGITVGVLANGVDQPYPRQNRELGEKLAGCGALVSEVPPGTPARPHLFPQRNRIISGLSLGVLVVEAGARSGSLITARLAMEQGRDVFAIPGSIHNPAARGCHQLIRAGAMLTETAEDIVTELADWGIEVAPQSAPDESVQSDISSLGAEEQALLGQMTYEAQSSDHLCEATGLTPSLLLQYLLSLELAGFVESTSGGYRKRAG